MKRLFLLLICLIVLDGCVCQPKPYHLNCVNVNYWHVEQGFNRGLYPMIGQLLTPGSGYPPIAGLVFDIQWVGLENRCTSPVKMTFGWYAVYLSDGDILYGIGGPDGVIELNAQVLRDDVLKDKPCIGGRCKK